MVSGSSSEAGWEPLASAQLMPWDARSALAALETPRPETAGCLQADTARAHQPSRTVARRVLCFARQRALRLGRPSRPRPRVGRGVAPKVAISYGCSQKQKPRHMAWV